MPDSHLGILYRIGADNRQHSEDLYAPIARPGYRWVPLGCLERIFDIFSSCLPPQAVVGNCLILSTDDFSSLPSTTTRPEGPSVIPAWSSIGVAWYYNEK
jgi:hypothetical protein